MPGNILGPVAAHAYKASEGHGYSTVVVISPSHRAAFPYVSVWPRGAYETPLGRIEIDESLCASLLESPIVRDDPLPHAHEHALEIQLPFAQYVLSSFRLCPLIMGRQDLAACEELASALKMAGVSPEETLVIASSDLSHFHGSTRAEQMDLRVAGHINSFDIAGLSEDLQLSRAEACGGGPIITPCLLEPRRQDIAPGSSIRPPRVMSPATTPRSLDTSRRFFTENRRGNRPAP
jgi:AmmeMemoRadiSam system protein B